MAPPRIDLKTLRERFPEVYEREVGRSREPPKDSKRTKGKSKPGMVAVPKGVNLSLWLPERRPHDNGPWTIVVPNWCPPSLNTMLYRHWAATARLKREALGIVFQACLACGVPKAAERRRVSIRLTLPRGRKQPDEDNIGKALRDDLVRCGVLVDDGPDWCETGDYPPAVVGPLSTTIILEPL